MIANNNNGRAQIHRCVSAILDNGVILETMYRPAERKTVFALWKGASYSEVPSADNAGMRFMPFSPANNLLTHGVVLLPSTVTEYDSRETLSAQVRAFLHRYCDLEEDLEAIAAHYVLFTWIYDAFNEVPYLRVKGDYGSGKTRFLLTVGSLCYKPIFASGASTVSPIFRILDAFRGTLILDESDFRESDEKSEITKILNNGNAAGFPVLRSEATPQKEYNPTAFHVFGPKIIASRRSFVDRALESRCITFDLPTRMPRKDIPLNLPEGFQHEATELRNKLLKFRFTERWLPRDLAKAAGHDQIEARIAQIFAPLIAATADSKLADRLRAVARRAERTLSSDRALSTEAQVLEVLKGMADDGVPLLLKEIARIFQEKFFAEYQHPITPRWIGSLLRDRFGIRPMKSNGNFLIPRNDLGKLRELYERYGLVGEIGDNVDEKETATIIP